MPRRVLVRREGASFDLVEVPAPDEHSLQEVIKANPQLIPTTSASTATCSLSAATRVRIREDEPRCSL